MARSKNARRGHRGKGELWSRRASAAAVSGVYNARWVKKVTTHKERQAARRTIEAEEVDRD